MTIETDIIYPLFQDKVIIFLSIHPKKPARKKLKQELPEKKIKFWKKLLHNKKDLKKRPKKGKPESNPNFEKEEYKKEHKLKRKKK